MFSGAAQLALLRGAQTCSPAGKIMPEILEEPFERAKSGLMLASAKTQALLVHIVQNKLHSADLEV